MVGRFPSEGTDAELDDGELVRGVPDLQVPYIGPVELERLPPRGAGDAGHLEVDGHEVGGTDMVPELRQRGFEVGGGHRLQWERRSRLRGGGGGSGGGMGGCGGCG